MAELIKKALIVGAYGADEKWIEPMLNNQEASDRLISNLSEFSNELDF